MKITGGTLWLVDDPALLRLQLDPTAAVPKLDPAAPPPLRFGVSTDDMISGAACTLGYSPEILGPHFLADFLDVVEPGAVARGGFEVLVGGDAYGSGSSREVAVVAHQGAGIKLVVARSFQRIFQENLVYCGLAFTTDFGVLDRLADPGAELDRHALSQQLPPLFAEIAAAGGLLPFADTLADRAAVPMPAPRPMTCIEKIIARHAWNGAAKPVGVTAVRPGEQWLCAAEFRGVHEYTGGMVMDLYARRWGDAPIERGDQVAAFEDHFVLLDEPGVPAPVKVKRLGAAHKLRDEMRVACERYAIPVHGPGRPLRGGVCHRIVLESYAEPGDLLVLTDSHTPTAGVLNAFAFGVGSTAMAFALRTGLIPVTVPNTVRVIVTGSPAHAVSPKDLILHIIGNPYFREERWRTTPTDTCVLQFGGPGLSHWDVDELSVLTNMTVEGGLMSGIVEPCAAIASFLRTQRGAQTPIEFVHADEGASYATTITLDLDDVPLTVATPGDSRNRRALAELGDVAIHNVVIASCTGGSLADLRSAAEVLRGRSLAVGVRLTITPSSQAVYDAAAQEGLLAVFSAIGATVTPPGCGSCIGNGPGIPEPGETTASTTNRNFARRMGAPGDVYLVSPRVAAAAAVTGKLTDPRNLASASLQSC